VPFLPQAEHDLAGTTVGENRGLIGASANAHPPR
jgi:hypothetical protein